MIDRSCPHPCGVDVTIAEVRRIMERENALPGDDGEDWLTRCARVAVSLGARAHGALRQPLHGPVRPLDGSEIAANRMRR